MAPARSKNITVHGNCSPLIARNIIYMKVIQSYVFDNREDCIISATKYNKLILEDCGAMLVASNRTATLSFEPVGQEIDFR